MKKNYLIYIYIFTCLLMVSCKKKEVPDVNIQNENTTFTISFITGNDTNIESQIIKRKGLVNKPVDPIKEGYTFIGWYDDDEKWSFSDYEVLRDVTLTAIWRVNESTIKFIDTDGRIINEITGEYKERLFIDDPVKEGYTFTGWDQEVPLFFPLNSTTFTANWQINQYTLEFKDKDGNLLSTITKDYQSTFTLPKPIKENSIFIGWDKEIPSNIPAYNETYTAIFGNIYKENNLKYMEFGLYPNNHIEDQEIIKALSNIYKTNERGFYEYRGKEYAKATTNSFPNNRAFHNRTRIKAETLYYFLVEPIKWRILEEKNGTYKLFTNMIIDHIAYNYNNDDLVINGKTIYKNNYEYSNIRAWLNGYDGSLYCVDNHQNKGFFNIAFSKAEQAVIQTILVDNSVASIKDETCLYSCNDTYDKVTLLSVADITNTKYGFKVSPKEDDPLRELVVSEYAMIKGVHSQMFDNFYGIYILRSPSVSLDWKVQTIYSTTSDYQVAYNLSFDYGCSPFITIKIDN